MDAAVVLERLSPLCVWCLNALDPHENIAWHRTGGDCWSCPYTGRDAGLAVTAAPNPHFKSEEI